MPTDPRATPAMQQYYRFKRAHPGCVLLFRIGDFYECFDEDAVTISKALGLTLTQRTEGVPMAGMPHHQIEVYLKRLVQQGYRVAIGDQVEDASQAKGLIRREVTRVVTPGTVVEESLLDDDSSTTIAAVCFTGTGDESPASVAIVDASTGVFVLADCSPASLVDELSRRRVRELLYSSTGDLPPPRVARVLEALSLSGTPRASWHFRADEAREAVLSHFEVSTVTGFGLADDDPALIPAGAIIRYLKETQTPASTPTTPSGRPSLAPRGTLAHLRPPKRDERHAHCVVDAVSLRSLEVERVLRTSTGAGGIAPVDRSLVGIFLGAGGAGGVCRTPMGKRLLRDWLVRPLADLVAIESRHSAVAVFVEDRRAAGEVGKALEGVQDVARIAGRLALDRATPRDLVALARSVARITELSRSLSNMPALFFAARALDQVSGALSLFASRTNAACVDDPPAHLREGGLFRDGIDAELDEYRLLQRDAGTWLTAFQQRLAAECNLPGIKVGFNRVFGYYIELTASQAKSAPALLTRKQTLKNAERYTTLELRDFESKVLSAETRSYERERVLFAGLCDDARTLLAPIQKYADTVATVDALLGFADRASAKGWVRPTMVPEPVLAIENARHPVLEEVLGADFVPNDAAMGAGEGSLALITGPNMAGKSTFIRQVALVVLLAHAGSFVPASRATIGLTDRIFTRIGADDALHAGQSTFMVEMTETANILNNASPRSLVILDEIGRGTSTLDGLSLAWAIAEFLGGLGSRTLFATHYHELTDLQDRLPARVRNLHVAVREWSTPDGHHEIVFLHRILPGATDQSYGIHVARLAGIPASVVVRAREVLDSLAVHHAPLSSARADTTNVPVAMPPPDGQMMLFTQYIPHPAIAHLKEVKLDTLSPMQAFDLLRQLRESAISPAP